MAKVQPSELRELVTICESIKIKDEKGMTRYEYEEICRMKAKVKHDKTSLFYDSERRNKTQTLIFITHMRRELLREGNFILYQDKYYRIIDIIPMDDHLYCQTVAEVVI